MGERKGNEGKKVMSGILAHPFPCENGLLSTLSGKGWTKKPFSGECEALRAFSTLLGHFRVILGPFGASSAKSRSLLSPTVLGPKAQWYVQNGEKLKIRPPGAVWSAILSDFGEVEF